VSSAAAPGNGCATDLDALAAAWTSAAEADALRGTAPLPTPHSTDVDGIAVLEDDGTFFFVDKNGNANLDVAAVGRAFYRTHGDDHDQLAVWLSSGLTNWLGSPTSLAAAWPIRNDVTGLGLSLYSYNTALGLPPRVQTILTLNGLHLYPDDPAAEVPGLPWYLTQDVLAHEFGHQWLAYASVETDGLPGNDLLGRAFQHWSFFLDADGSYLDGPDWVAAGPDSFHSLEPVLRFGPLDQYLMGVRAPAEVDSLLVLSPDATYDPPGPWVPYSDPAPGFTARGAAVRHPLDDVIAANGPRTPPAGVAPAVMRVAFVLVVPRGSDATAADLAKLGAIRAAFPVTVDGATGGRLAVDVALDSRPGRLVIRHARLPDTEAAGVPRAVGARVGVEPAGLPVAVDPAGVSLDWRTDPGAPWSSLAMVPAGADSFTAVLPGQPEGTTVEYVIRARSDRPDVTAELPDLAHSAPFRTRTGADHEPPVVTHWAQYEQAAARLPQTLFARATDGLGVDSVWCEWSTGGPTASIPATRVGTDSFTVALGAGAAVGTRIAYRLVARDASAAGNLGYSNPAFDTLRVGLDHVDGVWNPGPWTHANVLFNRREEWHVVELAGAPSGSAAWHCGLDSLPYGPYQDAALMSALVYDIAPGCSLTFVHRLDLEEAAPGLAFDGARVEVQPFGGAFVPLTPVGGYTHVMAIGDQGIPSGAPCWSGRMDDWRLERFDLTPFAPGPVRLRLRMTADLFVGAGGWWVDELRVRFPGTPTLGAPGPGAADPRPGPVTPNPARDAIRCALTLPAAGRVEWALHDVAGRRVATLWRGVLPAAAHELSARLPAGLAPGLYFDRLSFDGRMRAARRVVVVR